MTQYEVGAFVFERGRDGQEFKFKKDFIELIKKDPSKVYFYPVTAFPNPASESLRTTGDKFPQKAIALVTGPNPYSSRKWYAHVTYDKNGHLVAR